MATTTTRAQAGKPRPRSHANTLLRPAQILLAAVFAVAAVPKLAGLAAAGLAAGMAGATFINIAVLHSAAVAMTIPLCAAFALIAWHRREQTRTLAAAIRQHQQSPRQVTHPAGRQETSLTRQETTQ